MSRVLLLQLDGKMPNVALMRIAAHHRDLGDEVELRRAGNESSVCRELGEPFDRIYASLIFERTRPVAERLLKEQPGAVVGGTGWNSRSLEDVGIDTRVQDYSVYPKWKRSIGFLQRGCRLRCPFCVVPSKEGPVRHEQTVNELWRGEGHPRELVLLDNDYFGNPQWLERTKELVDGKFKVCFTQGFNARTLGAEEAEAIAAVDYRAGDFKTRRLYTAWDNRRDGARLFRGLGRLVDAGVKPRHIMVYMLIGYWAGETHQDREERRRELRDFGARPYPMPFVRTPELVAYQRWVLGGYDKTVPWKTWMAARGEPRRLQLRETRQLRLPTVS